MAIVEVSATGKRRHRAKVPAAMVENMVVRLQQIALRGTNMEVLRLASVMNEVFKQEKNGKNGPSDGPFPSSFRRPVPSEPAAEEPTSVPGTLIANGQDYVAG